MGHASSILGAIGNTPLVQLTHVVPEGGGAARVCVKLEYYNPTGSYKDRMALAMVERAEDAARTITLETGKPLAFHSGFSWQDQSMVQLNRFLSMHALSFVHFNMIHMTNWVINGLPERFPKLNVIWVESGLAWLPYLMQRLDSEYMMRSSEAPLLKKRPSEYITDMYYTSQPLECQHPKLLEATLEAIRAETQLLFSSDWPHWDFDVPATVTDLPFLDEDAKRRILGLNAKALFRL